MKLGKLAILTAVLTVALVSGNTRGALAAAAFFILSFSFDQ